MIINLNNFSITEKKYKFSQLIMQFLAHFILYLYYAFNDRIFFELICKKKNIYCATHTYLGLKSLAIV